MNEIRSPRTPLLTPPYRLQTFKAAKILTCQRKKHHQGQSHPQSVSSVLGLKTLPLDGLRCRLTPVLCQIPDEPPRMTLRISLPSPGPRIGWLIKPVLTSRTLPVFFLNLQQIRQRLTSSLHVIYGDISNQPNTTASSISERAH